MMQHFTQNMFDYIKRVVTLPQDPTQTKEGKEPNAEEC